jgi:hypothetical protein
MKYSAQEQEDYYGYIYVAFDQKHNKVYVGQKKGKLKNLKIILDQEQLFKILSRKEELIS